MNTKRKREIMKGLKLFTTIMLSALLVTGCGLTDNNAVMKVNDKTITQAKFNKTMDEIIAQSPFAQMNGIKDNKDSLLYLLTEQKVVNQLIIQELLDQEAAKRGIKVTEKDYNAAMQNIIDQVGGKDKLVELLKQNGVKNSDFKKDLENQTKMKKLANSIAKVNVTDKDCEAFYKKNIKKFSFPDQVRASHILIKANPEAIAEEIKSNSKKEISPEELANMVNVKMNEKRLQAENLQKELAADPTKFEKYARKYSEDEMSAKLGGDLGYFDKKRMVPEFAKVAFAQKPNTISNVVKTNFGYHIIFVTDRRAAGTESFDQAKLKIKEYLEADKQIKALDELATASKKTAKIEYIDESLNPETITKKLNTQMKGLTNKNTQVKKSK